MEVIVKFPLLVLQRAVFVFAALLVSFGGRATALDLSQTTVGYVRKNFTVEDGLLSNRVNAVVQTRDGFLWIGTEEGLLRFDGRHFTPIEFLPQASPVSVSALAEAPDGALWVGTKAGLARIPSGGLSELGHTIILPLPSWFRRRRFDSMSSLQPERRSLGGDNDRTVSLRA